MQLHSSCSGCPKTSARYCFLAERSRNNCEWKKKRVSLPVTCVSNYSGQSANSRSTFRLYSKQSSKHELIQAEQCAWIWESPKAVTFAAAAAAFLLAAASKTPDVALSSW